MDCMILLCGGCFRLFFYSRATPRLSLGLVSKDFFYCVHISGSRLFLFLLELISKKDEAPRLLQLNDAILFMSSEIGR